jgi:hypothetical protein
MSIRRHLYGIFREAELGDDIPHFVQRQRSAEGICEEVFLIRRSARGVSFDEALNFQFAGRAAEVAMKLDAAGGGETHGLGDHLPRLRDVMQDAVADDGVETCVGKWQALCVGMN